MARMYRQAIARSSSNLINNCEWLWLDTSSLSCQLKREDQLAQATQYSIVVKPGIETTDGSKMSESLNHSFITERPELENVYLLNWLHEHKPVASLYFNQPVTKSSVEKYVRLKSTNGQDIAVIAESDVNPLTDSYHQQLSETSEFKLLEHLPLGNTEESKAIAIEKANQERGGAYEEARTLWNVAPAKDLPVDTNIDINIHSGISSIYGEEVGIDNLSAHSFRSLPEFIFLAVQCHKVDSHDSIRIFSSEKHLRDPEGNKKTPNAQECDPQNNVSLIFSTPVSYATASETLKISPDLAGGRDDYDPWQTRNDSYYLDYFYERRFNYGDNDHYYMRLPESLKAFEEYLLQSNGALVDEQARPLDEPIDMSFLTAHRSPRLHFSHKHSVLEKAMQTELPITVTNLESLNLEGYSRTTASQQENIEGFSSTLSDAEDIAYAVPLGVRDMLDGQSGVIVGTLASSPLPPNYRADSYRFISQVTPFQVHFKFGQFNSYAWVTDMNTGKPVEGAAVRLDLNNYTMIEPFGEQDAAIKTDADGVAKLPGVEEIDPLLKATNQYRFEENRIMLKVAKGDDFAVLPLDSQYKSWPQIRQRLKVKDSYIHAWGTTAQGVYKAGDTIQYKLWVRNQDNRNWVAPDKGGYTLEIIDPKGQRVQQIKNLELSDFGSFDGEFKTSESAAVGWYEFILDYKANGQDYRRSPMRVLVSDFTPSPFRVSNETNGDQFQDGDTISLTTLARMHAGGPYADAETRITAQLNPRAFSSNHPEAKGFNFNDFSHHGSSRTIHQSNAAVDKSGELTSEFEISDFGVHYGRINIESAVRDDRGKYVASNTSADYLGRDLFVGLRNTKWTHNVGKKATIEHLVVNASGEPVDGVEVNLIVENYVTRAARVKGAGNAYLTQYSSEWVKTDECNQTSKLRRVNCDFTPEEPGNYRIIANIKDTRGRVNTSQISTWVVGAGTVLWGGANNSQIEIIPDEKSYKIGDVAKFLIKNPYPGAEALITVERYGVKRHWRKTLEGSTPIIEVPIEDDDYPGVYLSVVITSPRVAQPLGEGNVDLGKPAFKMGYVEVPVNDINKEIKIRLKTNKKTYKPREQVEVQLKAKPRTGDREPMEVAVVVIDEAVFDLNLSGEAYYDPYQGFNKLESLGVANYNLLMKLIGRQKFEKKGANPGGGGGQDGTSLRNLMKFVAYWNPSIELDNSGKAQFDFELPDNLTGWRVFAMAVTENEKMGLGDVNFKVNRPTELRPVMPNQLTEGDLVQAGFSVMNRTKKARTLTVELSAAGSALDKAITKTVKVKLAAFERKRVWLPVKADQHGELAFLAKAGDSFDKDAVEHHVPIAKRRSLVTAATYGTTIKESVSENFAYPSGIYQDIGGLSVVVSPSVIGNVAGAFRYLKDYPYACWEQRLSKGLAASQYAKLKPYLPDDLNWPDSDSLTKKTLSDAARFQAPNGGMTYWINNNQYVSAYLSAYTALGFAWLADQGHEIPSEVETKLHSYLRSYLRKDIKGETNGQQSMRRSQASIRAVALAALAARGKLKEDELLRYQSHVPDMDLFGKAHYLQAATSLNIDEQKLVEFSQEILSYSVQSGGPLTPNKAWR